MLTYLKRSGKLKVLFIHNSVTSTHQQSHKIYAPNIKNFDLRNSILRHFIPFQNVPHLLTSVTGVNILKIN